MTVSHQSEEMLEEAHDDWVLGQMLATRDAVTTNPFSEWLWGGMQYQLDTSSTMPRYRYPRLVPKIKQLCEEHGVEYRADGEFGIVKRNWDALKHVAAAEAVVGAGDTHGHGVEPPARCRLGGQRQGSRGATGRGSHEAAAAGSQAADVGRRRRAGCQPRERAPPRGVVRVRDVHRRRAGGALARFAHVPHVRAKVARSRRRRVR